MKEVWQYVRNNPLYPIVLVICVVFEVYVIWDSAWPLVWLLGIAIIVMVGGMYLNIKNKWR